MDSSVNDNISYFTVVCDASYKNGAGGAGIQICKRDRLYRPRKIGFKARGPQHSELIGIGLALKEVKNLAGNNKTICVICDSQDAIDICMGRKNARLWYIKEAYQDICSLLPEFNEVFFFSMRSEHTRKVDRWSKRAREQQESMIEERIEARFLKLCETFEKAKKIRIIEEGLEFYALSERDPNKRYEVSLDPPNCECPQFSKRWEKIPSVGVYSYRMPCKHICALALFLNRELELYRYV